MKNFSVRLAFITFSALALPVGSALALPWPFKKKAEPAAPAAGELQSQEAAAAALLAQAQAAEQAGKMGSAMATYKKIVKAHPLAPSAGTAQFRIAQHMEADAPLDAFDAYQTLIDSYKASPHFAAAIDAQFSIAQKARTEKLSSLMMIKKKLSTSQTLKLYEQVITNAPQGRNAPEAKFQIGQIQEDEGETSEAIKSYQDVVDQYPRSTFAAQAQKKVAELSFDKVADGSRDAGTLSESRMAAQEAALFPGSDMGELRTQIDEKDAENSYRIAKFYDRQKNYRAAMIYYSDVLRFPAGSNFESARDRVNELTTSDPSLLETANVKISNKQLALRAEADVKNRPDYLGPPAPADLDKALRKPKMRTGTDTIPITPIEEPALPGEKPVGKPDDTLLTPGTPALELPPTAPGVDSTEPMPEMEKEPKKPAEAKPAEEKAPETKPADEKPAADKPAAEKPDPVLPAEPEKKN
ncbi:MAG: tetratricopeptide repeat protein [Verrucomicrobiales bacterium]|nr:tetratricopeptide repeat protein [Verrucomicrobiales bacterium]